MKQALQKLPQDNVTLKFILQATGDVSNSDVDLAVASKAIIFGFNVKAPGSVKSYADGKGVEIRLYKVIYDLLDDMRTAMEGLLDPVEVRSICSIWADLAGWIGANWQTPLYIILFFIQKLLYLAGSSANWFCRCPCGI